MRILTFILCCLLFDSMNASDNKTSDAIVSGVPWYDQHGNPVSAHGACILKEGNRFYLFGEYKSDSANAFAGFSCYSSSDLYHWKFERMVLPVQKDGKLGSNRVGERVKVMKCLSTGEFVMFMHADDLNYKDQFVGYATSKTIDGEYRFRGPLLMDGKPVRKWDMGTFQDTDGKGYIITHSGNLYRLTDDYKAISAQIVKNMTPQCEAPVILKKNGIYFWIGSKLTSWEKNDNYYFTANSLAGPWTERGLIAPEGTLTWNSQSTFVLPINGSLDTTFLFMGDRWSFPRQYSSATYVWQPLTVEDSSLSIPHYRQSWRIDIQTGKTNDCEMIGSTIDDSDTIHIWYHGVWVKSDSVTVSSSAGSAIVVKFKGSQIGLWGQGRPDGGYAKLTLKNNKGKIILTSIIDMYCKYTECSQKFLSPILKKGNYELSVVTLNERPKWSDKRKSDYGSTGFAFSLDKLIVKP